MTLTLPNPLIFALASELPIVIRLIPKTLVVSKTPQPLGPHIIVYGLPVSGRTSIAQLMHKELAYKIVGQQGLDQKQSSSHSLFEFKFFGSKKRELKDDYHLSETLLNRETAAVIEGEAAIFAAKEKDKGVVVLLVASKDERIRRKTPKKACARVCGL